jgi:F0F1-type ATP synthase membrane subunit c/vacuolar-type H+-ATPase subunit K
VGASFAGIVLLKSLKSVRWIGALIRNEFLRDKKFKKCFLVSCIYESVVLIIGLIFLLKKNEGLIDIDILT